MEVLIIGLLVVLAATAAGALVLSKQRDNARWLSAYYKDQVAQEQRAHSKTADRLDLLRSEMRQREIEYEQHLERVTGYANQEIDDLRAKLYERTNAGYPPLLGDGPLEFDQPFFRRSRVLPCVYQQAHMIPLIRLAKYNSRGAVERALLDMAHGIGEALLKDGLIEVHYERDLAEDRVRLRSRLVVAEMDAKPSVEAVIKRIETLGW